MASKTVTISSGPTAYGAKPRATINMDTGNPNVPVTISVATRQRVGQGSYKTVNTTYTQASDGMFKDASGKVWSEEYSGGGGTVRAAMGKTLMKSNPTDKTIEDWGSKVTGAYTKDVRDSVAAGADGKGNDSGESQVSNYPSASSVRPPRRQSYDQKLMYPESLMDGISDFMKISMKKYKPAGIGGSQGATSRMRGASTLGNVLLPIPSGVTDSNSTSWGENTMNQLQMQGLGAANRVMQSQNIAKGMANEAKKAMNAMKGSGGQGTLARTFLLSQLPGINQSTNSLLSRGQGKVLNPNMELLFNGPQLRQFNYTFRLTPRNPQETSVIQKIIRFFKQGMSVKGAAGGLYLDAPNVFEVKFFHGSAKEHQFINKLKMCAMTNFAVNYVPDGTYMTLPDSSMTAYEIGLSLQEMDPILDSDYGTGNEIGY